MYTSIHLKYTSLENLKYQSNFIMSFGGGGDAMTMEVPSSHVGRIIGKGGSRIRELQDDSGCRINVNREGGSNGNTVVELQGSEEAKNLAKEMIQKICEEGNRY